MTISITRKADETLAEYQYRLYENRDDYGLSNQHIADLLNAENKTDYDESKFRKEYQILKNVWEPLIISKKQSTLPEEFAEEFAREQLKMNEKNRAISKMLQDQRREYRKLLDFSARFEHIKNEIFENVYALPYKPTYNSNDIDLLQDNKKELIVLMSDWHLGTVVNSRFNEFNVDICKQRIDYYLNKTLREIKSGNHHTVHLGALGDFVAGIIHVSSRTQAEEDIVRQLISVSEKIAEFVLKVAEITPNVHYYGVVGNHGRVIPNKSEVTSHEENFEKLIMWQLQARLQSATNVTFHEDRDGLIEANIMGEPVVFAHGDIDRQVNGADKLTQLLGYVPTYIFLGHTHHNFEKSFGITTVIVNPSLIGGDNYSIAGRFGGKAGQKMVTFEETPYGIDHTVKLLNMN